MLLRVMSGGWRQSDTRKYVCASDFGRRVSQAIPVRSCSGGEYHKHFYTFVSFSCVFLHFNLQHSRAACLVHDVRRMGTTHGKLHAMLQQAYTAAVWFALWCYFAFWHIVRSGLHNRYLGRAFTPM